MALLFDNNENNNTNEGQKKKMGEKRLKKTKNWKKNNAALT